MYHIDLMIKLIEIIIANQMKDIKRIKTTKRFQQSTGDATRCSVESCVTNSIAADIFLFYKTSSDLPPVSSDPHLQYLITPLHLVVRKVLISDRLVMYTTGLQAEFRGNRIDCAITKTIGGNDSDPSGWNAIKPDISRGPILQKQKIAESIPTVIVACLVRRC